MPASGCALKETPIEVGLRLATFAWLTFTDQRAAKGYFLSDENAAVAAPPSKEAAHAQAAAFQTDPI